MKRRIIQLLLLTIISLSLVSCLTIEKKEYFVKFTTKEGGEFTIIFYNIMSLKDDGKDVSKEDWNDLINNYLNGKKIEEEYPRCKIIEKKLYEDDGILCGKVVMKFTKMEDIKLYQHMGKGSVMYYISSINEIYEKSSGSFGGDIMPVVFWKKSKKLNLTTSIQTPDENTISLINKYLTWKESKY